VARLGGADHGAHPAQAALAGEALGELGNDAGEALVQRRLGRGQVLQVGGAGVAGADQGEDPRPSLGRGGDQGLEGVPPEQGVGGEGVGAKSRHGPPRGRRLADQRLRVGGGGDRDVAALSVGDDQQAGFPGRGTNLFEGEPAGGAEALEAGELRLDRDAGGAGAVDQVAAVLGDRDGRQLSGRRLRIAGTRPLPGQLGRIGVEAEADLAAALFDERREPIGKASQRISRP
jgi:hypothetical protein